MPFLPAHPADLSVSRPEAGRSRRGLRDRRRLRGPRVLRRIPSGRLLEAEGYRVGITRSARSRRRRGLPPPGRPRLAFLVGAGALDSMVSSYTANRKPRSDDVYAPGEVRALLFAATGG